MAAITNKVFPFIKNMKNYSSAIKVQKLFSDWDWAEINAVMNRYGFRLIFLTCLSPLLTIIPAYVFKLALSTSSFVGYLLTIILIIPWILIPSLFIQHITNRSKFGKISSYAFIGILFLSFILWINVVNI
ncbi:hypothetical protein [Sutcliffiella horikoshii]|uniref:Uncharacterized protein n=1 Tax=Sutcliffiella horikoshii TaxID=79883 RepID=A0A5D4TD04_9BACI|nr:hypothetical protein [Sutcliffiella horikoshii]TYS72392.1 hypothetical protein FZC75_10595 [Sutcliffiella horikoshii]